MPVPATGAEAVPSFIRSDLTVEVQWENGSGNTETAPFPFVHGEKYQAKITLSPRSPYSFDAGIPFEYSTAAVENLAGDNSGTGSRTLTVLYLAADVPAPIKNINLTSYIPAPVTGATPVPSFSAGTYGGTVEWSITGGNLHSGLFQAGTQYRAEVTLSAMQGYAFDQNVSVTHDVGDESGFQGGGETSSGSIEFQATSLGTPITDPIDLVTHIPAPVTGESPERSFVAEQYMGSVAWKLKDGSDYKDMPEGSFQMEKEYRAEVNLYPLPGYVFADNTALALDYTGNGTINTGGWTNNRSSITGITITFPATIGAVVTDSLDLVTHIPAPVAGEIPAESFVAAEYTGSVTWEMEKQQQGGTAYVDMTGGRFQIDKKYRAKVNLYALPGYVFAEENTALGLTYGGNGSINGTGDWINNRSSIKEITITFLDTDGVTVTALDLTPYIPAPAEGERPVTGPVSYAQYTVESVSWAPSHYVFKADPAGTTGTALTKYKAKVTLKAAEGYTFAGVSRFFHAEEDAPVQPDSGISGGTVTLNITFLPLSAVPTVGKTWYVADWGANFKNGKTPPSSNSTADPDVYEETTGIYNPGDSIAAPLATIDAALARAVFAKSGFSPGAVAEIVLLSDILPSYPGGNYIPWIDAITGSHPPIILRSNTSTPWTILMRNTVTNQDCISVTAGGNLTLKDIIIEYNGSKGNINLIKVEGDGTNKESAHLTFESGVVIQNAQNNHMGGAVFVDKGALFTMNKGIIKDNLSGNSAVFVNRSNGPPSQYPLISKFVMNGGTITGNTGSGGGGAGGVMNRSRFEMNGGTITGNTGSQGGGVCNNEGAFTMKGGTIYDNTGHGVFANGGNSAGDSDYNFTMEGGLIAGNTGAGVTYYAKDHIFKKTGGVIYGSEAGPGLANNKAVTFQEWSTSPEREGTLWEKDDWPLTNP